MNNTTTRSTRTRVDLSETNIRKARIKLRIVRTLLGSTPHKETRTRLLGEQKKLTRLLEMYEVKNKALGNNEIPGNCDDENRVLEIR